MSDKEQAKEKAVKEIEEFGNKVKDLLREYPDIVFHSSLYGGIYAYHRKNHRASVKIDR